MRCVTLLSIVFLTFSYPATAAEPLKIATWNIEHLNREEKSREERVKFGFDELRRTAKAVAADIWAVQEVENSKWLRQILGDDFNYSFSERFDRRLQLVGFAIRHGIKFRRHPDLTFKKTATIKGVGHVRYGVHISVPHTDTRLHLLAVHLKSGCFTEPETQIPAIKTDKKAAEDKIEAAKEARDWVKLSEGLRAFVKHNRLVKACVKLFNQIPHLRAWIEKRNVADEPFVILGDFNRRLALSGDDFWAKLNAANDLQLVTDQSPSPCMGFDESIDHVVVGTEAPLEVSGVQKHRLLHLTTEQFADRDLVRPLKSALSDHCPVSVSVSGN